MTSTARILVVDDDPALLIALQEALRLRLPQVTVDTADSGSTALRLLHQNEYDAVVTDIKMPGMDGLTLLAEIRKIRPEIPTLLITGHGQHDLAVEALRGGAFDLIQKPLDRDYFLAALERAIQMRQLGRQVQQQGAALAAHAAQLEETVLARTRELREANQAKDEFLAMLAHELRNPLAVVQSAVELMMACTPDDPGREDALRIVGRQVRQMSHLLCDLLDLSRITRRQISLRTESLDIRTVVTAAAESLRTSIEQHQHWLTIEAADDPVIIDGDPTRLEQVVINLLNNAIKYTDPGGRICVSVTRQDDRAVITVEDSGLGISPEMLPRVFDPFTQEDRSLERSKGGLGIGLSLVQELVRLHGGDVHAASDGIGCGSVFTIRLPLARQTAPTPEPAHPSGHAPRRILLVDDNPEIASITALLLTKCGHHVVGTVGDGPSALEAAVQNAPDVILMDIGLPGMSGYEVARRLRKEPRLKQPMIVAMTGYGLAEDRQRSKEAGFDLHLVKPVSVEMLQAVLASDRAAGVCVDSPRAS